MEDIICPECNIKIEGNYCAQCGTKKVRDNWRELHDFGLLLSHPLVQDNVKRNLAKSNHTLSAEEFLEKVDSLIPIKGVSLNKLADVVVPIYTQLGIKTGKSQTASFPASIQEVFVKALCSLAKNNYPLSEVQQVQNGAVLLAKIPSDMKTFGGDIIISLQESEERVQANIDAKISGQLFDWGKSKSVIRNIFNDIETIELHLG